MAWRARCGFINSNKNAKPSFKEVIVIYVEMKINKLGVITSSFTIPPQDFSKNNQRFTKFKDIIWALYTSISRKVTMKNMKTKLVATNRDT